MKKLNNWILDNWDEVLQDSPDKSECRKRMMREKLLHYADLQIGKSQLGKKMKSLDHLKDEI